MRIRRSKAIYSDDTARADTIRPYVGLSLKIALNDAANLINQFLTFRLGSPIAVDDPALSRFGAGLKPIQTLPRIEMLSVNHSLVGDTYLIAVIGKPASSGIPDSKADLNILHLYGVVPRKS